MPIPYLSKSTLLPLEQAVNEYLDRARAESRNITVKSDPKHRKVDPRQMTFQSPDGYSSTRTEDEGHVLKILHWRVDAEVLRLYDLSSEFERKILDLFRGARRRGVPFTQTEYFRKDFADLDRLADLLAITADWPKTNQRRAELMDLEEDGALTLAQEQELLNLQRLADASVSLTKPESSQEIDRVIVDLKRRGLWTK
jgi:hypothetical protein